MFRHCPPTTIMYNGTSFTNSKFNNSVTLESIYPPTAKFTIPNSVDKSSKFWDICPASINTYLYPLSPYFTRVLSRTPVIIKTTLALRSEEHTSELQSHVNLVCRLLLEK